MASTEADQSMFRLCVGTWYAVPCRICSIDVLFPHQSDSHTAVRCPSCGLLIDMRFPENPPFAEGCEPDEKFRVKDDDAAHPTGIWVSSGFVREAPPPDGSLQLQALFDAFEEENKKANGKSGLIGAAHRTQQKLERLLDQWRCTRWTCQAVENLCLGKESNRIGFVRVHQRLSKILEVMVQRFGRQTAVIPSVLVSPDAGCCLFPATLLFWIPLILLSLCYNDGLIFTDHNGWEQQHQTTTSSFLPQRLNSKRMEQLFALLFVFICGALVSMWLTILTNPGYVLNTSAATSASVDVRQGADVAVTVSQKREEDRLMLRREVREVVNGVEVTRMWCDVCEHVQPLRAVHCKTCGLCVVQWDHHCHVIGACIGKGNLRFFLIFLGFTTGACVIGLVIAVAYMVRPSRSSIGFGFAASLVSFIIACGFGVSGMFCAGLVNAGNGVTYRERVRRVFGRKRERSGSHNVDVAPLRPSVASGEDRNTVSLGINPYDEGCIRNCSSVWC